MDSAQRHPAQPDTDIAWQLVEQLDEQRGHPRVPMHCSVEFRNASGQHCVAKLLNISPDGIQIRCNIATAQVLHPGGGRICPTNAPIVQTEIALSLPRGEAGLSICSRLTYLTTVSQEPKCVMGLRFLEPRPKAAGILAAFFAAEMHTCFGVNDDL